MYSPLSDSVASPNPGTPDKGHAEPVTASPAASPCQTKAKDATASSAATESNPGWLALRASTSDANPVVVRGAAPAGGSALRLVYTTLDDLPSSPLVSRVPPDSPHNVVLIRDFENRDYELVCISSASVSPKRKHTEERQRRKKSDETEMDEVVMAEADHRRSVARSIRNMRHRVYMLKADRLLTLTSRENKIELKACWRDLTRFVRAVKKQLPEFLYVAVPERQKRGAIHFHLAVSGFYNVNVLRYLWRRVLCGDGNASGENSPGNIDITSPRGGDTWQRAKLARYLAKYIGKNMDYTDMNGRRFSSSCSIAQPKITRLYLPVSDDTYYRLTQIMNSISRNGVVRKFEFGGPVPGTWMSSF